jgi:hypothetical protein
LWGRYGRLAAVVGAVTLALVLAACSHASAHNTAHVTATGTPTAPTSIATSPGGNLTGKPAAHFAQPQQELFTPYDENGILDVDVSKRESGQCWTSSIAMPISGVFRCMVDNEIMDPCFAPAVDTDPVSVTCFADPWTPGITITLSQPLPTEDLILKDGNPWALELANGARCVVLTGALPVLGTYTLQYRCGQGAVASLQTDENGDISAMYGPADGPLEPTGILTAWRGQSYRFGSS